MNFGKDCKPSIFNEQVDKAKESDHLAVDLKLECNDIKKQESNTSEYIIFAKG